MERLEKEFVIKIHDDIIKKYNGLEGIKDEGALESSLVNAFTTFFGEDLYKTDIEKINNIFFLLNKNHSFVDANKRTSVTIFNILLKINNYDIKYKLEEIEELALDVATDDRNQEDVNKWVREHLVY